MCRKCYDGILVVCIWSLCGCFGRFAMTVYCMCILLPSMTIHVQYSMIFDSLSCYGSVRPWSSDCITVIPVLLLFGRATVYLTWVLLPPSVLHRSTFFSFVGELLLLDILTLSSPTTTIYCPSLTLSLHFFPNRLQAVCVCDNSCVCDQRQTR